jgi:membrane-bound lytic murein transglycosylase MltF
MRVVPTLVLLAGISSVVLDAQTVPSNRASLSLEIVTDRWTGDFGGMVKRRRIRILTPYNRTHYFVDRGVQRGLVYEAGLKLEAEINGRLKTSPASRVHVVFVPAARDELYRWLVEGRGDLVATNIPVTPERRRLVDFTTPTRPGINQILATGPDAPAIRTVDDLQGAEVAVREESVELAGLVALNEEFARRGRAPIVIRALPRTLEDEDLLEMVNAGLVRATVVDEFTGQFWIQVLPSLALHPGIVVGRNLAMAWAARKGSPELLAALNPIIEANRAGTAFGNALLTNYLRRAKVVGRATSSRDLTRFRSLTALFQKYADRYELDHLLMMAQAYQESGLDQHATSRVGAIGIMQVMPATAAEMKTGDIRLLEPNVHAGVKYIRWIVDHYFAREGLDSLNQTLFALAAYNCGAGRLQELRRETARRGLNPREWFNNVERLAAERIGRETVQYVSSIYKYYIAYKLAENQAVPASAAERRQ